MTKQRNLLPDLKAQAKSQQDGQAVGIMKFKGRATASAYTWEKYRSL